MICPHCGRAVLIEPRDESTSNGSSSSHTLEVVIPCTVTGSSDDLEAPPAPPGPEPEPQADATLGDLVFDDPNLDDEEPLLPGAMAVPEGSKTEILDDPLKGLSHDTAPPPAPRPAPGSDAPAASISDEDPPAGVARWAVVVLASYASAVTLACLWLALGGRGRWRDDLVPETIPADSRPDLGRRADRSQGVQPATPIPADRLTRLGQPIRTGTLEFTPLGVAVGGVTLENYPIGGRRRVRAGGDDALWLRARFRNLSPDLIFAPLDEAFVREPDRGLPDSFIEAGNQERIYMYPLAVESEWSIVGQAFPLLRPGEVAETVVVSATGAIDRAAGEMTWRLRLRTGQDRTEEVGVRFDAGQIERGASRAPEAK